MRIIGRYFVLSIKKNFNYPVNGIMVIFDTLMDCFSIFLFWLSLMEMDVQIGNWDKTDIGTFIGFNLISMGILVLFSGAYDIQKHILDGSLDTYLIKPCSSLLLIVLERANFLRFLVSFPLGIVLVGIYDAKNIGTLITAMLVCVMISLVLGMIRMMLYLLAFWLRKMDSFVRIYETILSVKEYPLQVLGRKVFWFFTYIIPAAFTATIPTEFCKSGVNVRRLLWAVTANIITFVVTKYIWLWGRKTYESTN